jgi:pimeloyl-ACP methyl ester carboxylesterase
MIRGESILNPPLVLLHDGPGFSETTPFRHFIAALEKSFTVVYWDQRGAGKSHRPATSTTATLRPDAFIRATTCRSPASTLSVFGGIARTSDDSISSHHFSHHAA